MKIAAVFDGETLSAAGVRKIDTDNPKAFTDTMKNSNPLSIQKIIKEKDYFINVPQIIFPKIRTISVVTGADMTAISSAVNDGSQIVILDAFGKGNINLEATEEIKQNSDKTIFIITSRVLYGNAEPVYTPAKLAQTHGVLFAGRLSLEKTVLLSGLFVSQPHVQALDFKKRKRELQKALDLANQ
jgi:L-asparaginase/Glu-tRNA(Gln) amidotransferase subunit D